jgi:hypothetical protein
MLDFDALLRRVDAALAEAPSRNPDYGSDVLLSIADACVQAAVVLERTGRARQAETYRAAATGFRNRGDRARALAPAHALPLRTVNVADVPDYLRREA